MMRLLRGLIQTAAWFSNPCLHLTAVYAIVVVVDALYGVPMPCCHTSVFHNVANVQQTAKNDQILKAHDVVSC
jgi:hypothetical protein